MTVRLGPSNWTRAPFELGCRPSPASMMPAFTSSSLYFIIAVSSSSLGMMPASLSLVALTITINRIVVSPLVSGSPSIGLYCHDERQFSNSTSHANYFWGGPCAKSAF